MWHKGGGKFYCGVAGKELVGAEVDDSVIHHIEPNYKKDGTNDDDGKDVAEFNNHKRTSLQINADLNVCADDYDDDNDDNNTMVVVDYDEDGNNNNDNVEKEEKDEAFYPREE